MKIAVIGSGALGTFYGAKLLKNHLDIQFQSISLSKVKDDPIEIKSIWGNFNIKMDIFEDTKDMQMADVILVATKTYPHIDYESLLRPILKKNTIIVCMQNGIQQEEKWQSIFKDNPIIGALAFTCINRVEANKITHLDYGKITLAPLVKEHSFQTIFLKDLFVDSGIETELHLNLRQIRWNKLLWNIPFNSLSVILNKATTKDMLSSQYSLHLVKQLMLETQAIANSESEVSISSQQIEAMIAATIDMKPYKTSMLLDYENNNLMEVDAILGEPLKIAQKNNINTPHIEWVYNTLKYYNSRL